MPSKAAQPQRSKYGRCHGWKVVCGSLPLRLVGNGRGGVPPASRLPKVIEAWDHPRQEEFAPRAAWSLFNGFTEVEKSAGPRAQMEGTLRLSVLFRRELHIQ